mmetsp:Transcript_65400/g.136266  ORF Transcript_65400/g.136266 Transcript_65400/m.136266 type:complete len:219 (-) Transcript_65400:203-859(-)
MRAPGPSFPGHARGLMESFASDLPDGWLVCACALLPLHLELLLETVVCRAELELNLGHLAGVAKRPFDCDASDLRSNRKEVPPVLAPPQIRYVEPFHKNVGKCLRNNRHSVPVPPASVCQRHLQGGRRGLGPAIHGAPPIKLPPVVRRRVPLGRLDDMLDEEELAAVLQHPQNFRQHLSLVLDAAEDEGADDNVGRSSGNQPQVVENLNRVSEVLPSL